MPAVQRLRIRNWDKHYENNRTRELKHLEWVPVPNRMDTDNYAEFVDHPNAAAHYGAWVAIISIASRQEQRGIIPQHGAGIPQSLARISRLPKQLFEEVIPRLLKLRWIEYFQEDIEQSAEIPQDTAEIPQDGALKGREGNRRKGREQNSASRMTLSEPTQEMSRFASDEMHWTNERLADVWNLFADHWKASASPSAIKLDWLAAWRIWCRRERDIPVNGNHKTARQRDLDESWKECES
jgi:hypothetical protein